jgi:4-hydroxy-4-methyl-2-oxoglutarate aldolase
MNTTDIANRFSKIPTATVYDVMDKMGFPNQALSAEIRPLCYGIRIAGPALTVRGTSTATYDGKRGSAMSFDMFRAIQPGQVIVMDTGGHKIGGPWGGNTGADAKVKGAVGVVIDGGTRDRADLLEMGLPCYCRFVTPVLSHGRFQIEAFNEPISVAGQVEERVQILPGDILLADDDGVVIIPAAIAAAVLSHSEVADRAENQMRKAIETGEDRERVNRRINRWPNIRK